MTREHTCEYGNCNETSSALPIVVTTDPGKDYKHTVRFCGETHAIAWLADRFERRIGKVRVEVKT